MVTLAIHWLVPHYSNNHRPKLLQPIGLAVIIGVFVFCQSCIQLLQLSPALPGGYVLGYASSITAAQVVELSNIERAKAGLPPLTINEKLNQAALAKATHMFQYDYWAHIAPDGTTPWVFIKNSGYAYAVAGENLARDFGDTSSMTEAWMNSPTHKANIIHSKYKEIGVAVVNGKLQGTETTLVVQMFGSPATVLPATDDTAAQSSLPVATTPPQILAIEPTQPQPALGAQTDSTKMVSPLAVTKVTGSILITLLVLVLTYDMIINSRRQLPRRVGNNWAHVGLFGIVMLLIALIAEGKVL